MSDSGMHTHAGLNRELRVTSLDGSHDHEFRLPDGSTVRTSVDGGHAHTIDMEGMHFVHGGVHAHRVVVDGVELQTEVDGWHGHEIGENKVSEGGMHSHALVLPTGETVISLHVDTDTEQAKRKKGANRKREPVTEKHLDAVTTSAKAVLDDLRTEKQKRPYKKPKKKTTKSLEDGVDISPPRARVMPKYDPATRKIIR